MKKTKLEASSGQDVSSQNEPGRREAGAGPGITSAGNAKDCYRCLCHCGFWDSLGIDPNSNIGPNP